jgi:hypothetical protein
VRRVTALFLAASALTASACGSSKPSGASSQASVPSAASSSPGALAADATSAATGDIPDNQVFLTFHNHEGGYSIKFPEGWTQRGSGRDVTFQDKNNIVHIAVIAGGSPTASSVAAQLQALHASDPTVTFKAPQAIRIGSTPAIRATYTTESSPNPVTGKRVRLIVDRYELGAGSWRALVDLGTPEGVDNVDAYRMMIESFRWL